MFGPIDRTRKKRTAKRPHDYQATPGPKTGVWGPPSLDQFIAVPFFAQTLALVCLQGLGARLSPPRCRSRSRAFDDDGFRLADCLRLCLRRCLCLLWRRPIWLPWHLLRGWLRRNSSAEGFSQRFDFFLQLTDLCFEQRLLLEQVLQSLSHLLLEARCEEQKKLILKRVLTN